MRKILIFGAAFAASMLFLIWYFPEFWPEICRSVADGKWWADSLLNWVVFGLAIAFFYRAPDWIDDMRRYRGRQLVAMKDGVIVRTYLLGPTDAREILTRSYAGWQMIKSIASTSGIVEQPYYDEAIDIGLLIMPPDKRSVITINLDKLGKRGGFASN
jgi:hypothetical protein